VAPGSNWKLLSLETLSYITPVPGCTLHLLTPNERPFQVRSISVLVVREHVSVTKHTLHIVESKLLLTVAPVSPYKGTVRLTNGDLPDAAPSHVIGVSSLEA
jgi:hypothetical protein